MHRAWDVRGFSLIEMMAVVAILLIAGALTIPAVTSGLAEMRVSSAAREVERELQTARMRAVQSDRAIRVRFNCPAAGQYRMVEVIGSQYAPAAADSSGNAATRCSEAAYPYPDPDPSYFAFPNHDGPVRTLPDEVSFGTVQAVEFWPDGTAHIDTGGTFWSVIPNEGITLTLYDNEHGSEASAPQSLKKSITVNGLGKVTLN